MLPLRAAGQVALIGLFVLALLAALYVTRGILVPVLLAVIIGTILSPLVGWLQLHRIPRTVSAIVVVAMLFSLLAFLEDFPFRLNRNEALTLCFVTFSDGKPASIPVFTRTGFS